MRDIEHVHSLVTMTDEAYATCLAHVHPRIPMPGTLFRGAGFTFPHNLVGSLYSDTLEKSSWFSGATSEQLLICSFFLCICPLTADRSVQFR